MGRIFFEFPLILLSLISKIDDLYKIINYCLVHLALSYKDNEAEELFAKYKITKVPENYQCIANSKKIMVAGFEQRIQIDSIGKLLDDYNEADSLVKKYTSTYGKDAYCRIGRDLILETYEGSFNFEVFKVYCGIQSILGKNKTGTRITLDRIRYRMHGYKSKKIALLENPELKLLTDKMLKNRIDKLHKKEIVARITFKRRQTYYSTRLNDDELTNEVVNKKIIDFQRKKDPRQINKKADELYDQKLKNLLETKLYGT